MSEKAQVAWNGSDFVRIGASGGAGVFSSITNTGLTSGRVVYSTTGGLETDSANLTFNGTTLTANTLNLTNALGTTYGGTGLTSFTSGGVVYASSSSVLATGSRLTFDGTEVFKNSGGTVQYNDVIGSAAAGTRLSAGGTLGTDSFDLFQNTSIAGIYNRASTPIAFAISSTEQMRLTSTGLGIGTSSPAAKLHVGGNQILQNTGSGIANNSIRWQNSSGTFQAGIASYFNTADTGNIEFLNGGTTNMQLSSSGNLGLGVTPSAWNSAAKAIQISTAATFWGISNNQAYVGSNSFYDSGGNFKYIVTDNATQYRQWQGAHTWFNAPSGTAGNAITFTQAMTLDASGNLGIGGTANNYAGFKTLAVIGPDATHSGIVRVRTSDDAIGMNIYADSTGPLFNTTNNPLRFLISDTERMRLDSSGNLGLGVTPSAWGSSDKAIDIGGGNQSSISANLAGAFVTNAYFNGTDWKYKNSTGSPGLYSQSFDGQHKWFRASSGTAGNTIAFTQAMTLDASGNLLVGTTAFANSNTNSAILQASGGTCAFIIQHDTGNLSGNAYEVFNYNGSAIGSITQSGTTAVLYNVTSDQRLKENIQDADSASSLIDSLQVRQFDWKTDNTHQRYGFVAQEIVSVAPEAVHQPADPEEMMAVDYSKLVPMLVKEIQSLRIRISQLEAK